MPIAPILLIGDSDANTQTTVDFMVNFANQAKKSLHITIYDFRIEQEETLRFVDTLEKQAKDGIEVMIAYDHRNPPSLAPASKSFAPGDDPAPKGTHDFLTSGFGGRHPGTHVKVKAIEEESIAGSKLMHQKIIVADGRSVLMGSANFTDDAWARQDNNILAIDAGELADYYETDFQEIWSKGSFAGTGQVFGQVTSSGLDVGVRFSPGQGKRIDAELCKVINEVPGGQTLHLASMVITSGTILAAVASALDRGVIVHGIYDGPEMSSALRQMKDPTKIALMKNIMDALVAKHSTPYDPKHPNGLHDFMHDKLLVAGPTVATGSFNFSESAEHNAEDVLFISDPQLAHDYAAYVEALVARWGTGMP